MVNSVQDIHIINQWFPSRLYHQFSIAMFNPETELANALCGYDVTLQNVNNINTYKAET